MPFCSLTIYPDEFVQILVGRPERKRPLGRLWRRWEDNIKMDVKATECNGVDWIYLAMDKVK
jgi:hypothetical protein